MSTESQPSTVTSGRALSEDVHVKFSKPDLALLEKTCEARGETLSAFIRVATLTRLAHLGLLEKGRGKTLGVLIQEAGASNSDPQVGLG